MIEEFERKVVTAIMELLAAAQLTEDQILVVGASSSEVLGHRIGTHSSQEVAQAIVSGVLRVRANHPFHVAFQSCEHLNRALVTERRTWRAFQLEEVTVVPAVTAGGAVAATAYRTLQQPVMVEQIAAHAGIDIGDTLIGMHLRRVAVPVRLTIKDIGFAHVTAARTRPKLIGGARAVYQLEEQGDKC